MASETVEQRVVKHFHPGDKQAVLRVISFLNITADKQRGFRGWLGGATAKAVAETLEKHVVPHLS